MRAHATRDERGSDAERARPVVAPITPAQRMPALQRAAGNAAVARALSEEQHGHGAGRGNGPSVQRSAVHDVLRSPGQPLAGPLKHEMEGRFGGEDFSSVRMHSDPAALSSAAEIGADAYASGSHIVWDGKDKTVLAEELHHTRQQARGEVPGTEQVPGLRISDPGDWAETEARQVARSVMSGPAPAVQRAVAQETADGTDRIGAVVQRAPSTSDGQVSEGETGDRTKPTDVSPGEALRDELVNKHGREFHRASQSLTRAPMGGPAAVQRAVTAGGPAQGPHVLTTVQRASGGETGTEERQETGESARGQSLRMRDHDNNELFSGDDDLLADYVRHLAEEDRADIYRLLLNRLSRQGFDAQAVSVQQVWDGADKPQSARRVQVPRDLHFIWLGGKPGDSVIANLNAWKENVEDSDWTMTLWTDAGSSTLKGLEKTFGKHLKIRADSDKLVKAKAGTENYRLYKDAKSKKALNLASDILRYTVMAEFGGVYMDVDVAPGSIQLKTAPEVLMRSTDIPLLAPRLRDKNSVNSALGREETDQDPTAEDLNAAADARYDKGILGNNFILAPGSEFMGELLRKLPAHFNDMKEKYGPEVIEGDLPGLAPDISGPAFVEKVLKQYTGRHHRVMEQDHSTAKAPDMAIERDEFKHLFPPEALEFWKALGWWTPESEKQLDRTPGLSRTQSLLRALRVKK
ncbi:DUF4157 domain-containing protein [Streptomyces sp. NPDC008092]|uniref:eCIS core domain-containing protein n=1 Tax=Streptomyces sp. NPDC008092 TaxID=3364808 RepID=UPI0036E0B501